LISKHGGKGVGLSGSDGTMIVARKIAPQRLTVDGVETEVDLGWVGETEEINPEILLTLAERITYLSYPQLQQMIKERPERQR